ncbi:baseplate J/gp47 family protein [Candidatus Saccharibacteria bacterium]|nr:baseplate J/gp47 family protein [Candidatus Saccharibacteria bacterium]
MSEKKKSVGLNSSDQDKLVGRDTIYIDTEDDITSIIEKVKASDSSVLALVPPKRTGVLQSVVSLKLLQKTAKLGRKKIALITTDAALIALAAGLRIPVARNLTTQPELPEAPELDDSDSDIINGDEIAIGDLARATDRRGSNENKEVSAAVKAIETDDRIKNDLDADGTPDDKPKPKKPPKSKRLPDFNSFRKKLFIFGSLGLALIIFLVWAIVFAPRGTIIITAETTSKDVNVVVSLRPNADTDIENKVIKPTIKQIKKTETINFTATGSKEIGDKATGKVEITNKSGNSRTFSAGSAIIASGGQRFVFNETITVAGASVSGGGSIVYGSVTTAITAANIGASSNISGGTTLSVTNGGLITIEAKGDFTGGSSETVKVVQESDLDLVTEKLKNQGDQNSIKTELEAEMGDDVVVLSDSFVANYGAVSSKPALGEAVENGDPRATMEITYTIIGIAEADLENLVKTAIGETENQKIYDSGVSKIQFINFTANENSYSVTIKTTAQVGPDLDKREKQIKERAVGKRSGEIVSDIESIPGVSSVKVQFSPFWVKTAPEADKLKVEFAVNE